MRKRTVATWSSVSSLSAAVVLAGLLLVSAAGAAERSIVLGAEDEWRGIIRGERVLVRPGRQGFLDLTLEPFSHQVQETTELLLGFDELPVRDASGNYVVDGSPELTRTSQRTGTGALLVDGPGDRLTITPGPGAALTPGAEWASFTIEFWFYPVVFTERDRILSWSAREGAAYGFRRQELAVEIDRGVVSARFDNFFVRPDGEGVNIVLRGTDRLIPRTWSHHLIRFDARTALLEYVVDGVPVDVTYASRTGRQDGTIYFPRIASHPGDGLVVAGGFVGAIDELRIERRFVDSPVHLDYAPAGGAVISDFIDLGSEGARLSSVDAVIATPGLSDVFLYYRLVNLRERDPTAAEDWIAVRPGSALPAARGRFVQVRAELYPDTRDGVAPRLSRITINYEPAPPPQPPTGVRAVPHDGAVTLEWAPVHDPDIEGYLVYYGDQSGRYFGVESEQGVSPVDVGLATSVMVEGLANGTLYFFAVQAYDSSGDAGRNELSTEVAARPAKVYR